MKKVLYIIAFIILSIILFLIYLDFSEIEKNFYNNKQDVLKDNAILRGWIPEVLPNSAYNISEIHDIDTNNVEGNFQYFEKDEKNLLNDIRKNSKKSNFEFKVDKEKNKVLFFTRSTSPETVK